MSSTPSITSADAGDSRPGDSRSDGRSPDGIALAGGGAATGGVAPPDDIASPVAVRRPGFAFMRPRLARWIALGFGSGLSPRAPGTVGTLWAWVAWLALPARRACSPRRMR